MWAWSFDGHVCGWSVEGHVCRRGVLRDMCVWVECKGHANG